MPRPTSGFIAIDQDGLIVIDPNNAYGDIYVSETPPDVLFYEPPPDPNVVLGTLVNYTMVVFPPTLANGTNIVINDQHIVVGDYAYGVRIFDRTSKLIIASVPQSGAAVAVGGVTQDADGNVYMFSSPATPMITKLRAGDYANIGEYSFPYGTVGARVARCVGDLIYSTHLNNIRVRPINDLTNETVIKTLPHTFNVIALAVSKDGNYLYIFNPEQDGVWKISTSNPEDVTNHHLGLSTTSAFYSLDIDHANNLYIGHGLTIKKYDSNMNLVKTISTGAYRPWSMTVDKNQDIYFTVYNSPVLSTKKLVRVVAS